MELIFQTALIVFVVVAVIFIWAVIKLRKVRCPVCGTKPPLLRIPKNRYQALWGGWTCSKCGAELDRNGQLKRQLRR